MENDKNAVMSVLSTLKQSGFKVALFGGWAEEVQEIASPKPHGDIDLLLLANSFDSLDSDLPLGAMGFTQIKEKHFAHKRAYSDASLMVEFTLVENYEENPTTMFWGDVGYKWRKPLYEAHHLDSDQILCATIDNLQNYRAERSSIQPWRWREQQ